jgi:hypothetical protein
MKVAGESGSAFAPGIVEELIVPTRWRTAPSRELGSNIKPFRGQTRNPGAQAIQHPKFCTPRGGFKFWTAIDIIVISEKASLDGLFVLEGNGAWSRWVA